MLGSLTYSYANQIEHEIHYKLPENTEEKPVSSSIPSFPRPKSDPWSHHTTKEPVHRHVTKEKRVRDTGPGIFAARHFFC
jgi:hypothetical protein